MCVCVMFKGETETDRENKSQTTTSDVVVSSRKSSSKVASDVHPQLPSKTGGQSLRSSSHRSTASSLKQSTDTATVSATVSQQLDPVVSNKTAPVRNSSAAVKRPTSRYKPAHHSAPFRTTPLPPGKSKLPPVSRPGSRKNSTPLARASHSVEARGTDRLGGKITAAISSASKIADTRRKIHSGGRTIVTDEASVLLNGPRNAVGRNSSSNFTSEIEVSDTENIEPQRTDSVGDSANIAHGDLRSCCEISSTDGISVENVITRTHSYPDQTSTPDDVLRTFDATSSAIGQQTGSTSADRLTANDVPWKTEAVVQSMIVVQPNVSLLHTDETASAENSASFILHRDGQVAHVVKTTAILPPVVSVIF